MKRFLPVVLCVVLCRFGFGAIITDGSSDICQYTDTGEMNVASDDGDYAVAFWVNLNSALNDYDAIYAKTTDGTGASYTFQGNGGADPDMYIYHSNASGWDTTVNESDLSGAWHHVAISRNGNTQSVYLDGSLHYSGSFTTDPSAGAGALKIGADRSETYFAPMEICEFYIWNDDISARDVSLLFTSRLVGVGLQIPNLAFYEPFNETMGSASSYSCRDMSGNGNDGTANGTFTGSILSYP